MSSAYYPVILSFTRTFTKGALRGLTHNDSMGFVSEARARAWVREVSAPAAARAIGYQVSGVKVARAAGVSP